MSIGKLFLQTALLGLLLLPAFGIFALAPAGFVLFCWLLS